MTITPIRNLQLTELGWILKRLDKTLTVEYFEKLSPEKAAECIVRLKEVNAANMEFLGRISEVTCLLPPLCKKLVAVIAFHADNIENTLEALELGSNQQFRAFLSRSIEQLRSDGSSTVVHMHR